MENLRILQLKPVFNIEDNGEGGWTPLIQLLTFIAMLTSIVLMCAINIYLCYPNPGPPRISENKLANKRLS